MAPNDRAKTYRIYLIKCLTSGCIYISYTGSTNPNYDPLKYLFSNGNRDPTKYVKLMASINEHGYKNHTYVVNDNKLDKDTVDKKVYDLRLKFADKSLNDLDPVAVEKETCDKCNQTYRVAYRALHQARYCKINKLTEELKALDELFD